MSEPVTWEMSDNLIARTMGCMTFTPPRKVWWRGKLKDFEHMHLVHAHKMLRTMGFEMLPSIHSKKTGLLCLDGWACQVTYDMCSGTGQEPIYPGEWVLLAWRCQPFTDKDIAKTHAPCVQDFLGRHPDIFVCKTRLAHRVINAPTETRVRMGWWLEDTIDLAAPREEREARRRTVFQQETEMPPDAVGSEAAGSEAAGSEAVGCWAGVKIKPEPKTDNAWACGVPAASPPPAVATPAL